MSKILTIDPKVKKVLVRDVAANLFEQKLIQMNLTYTKGQVISGYPIGFSQYPFIVESPYISEDQFNQLAQDCRDESENVNQQCLLFNDSTELINSVSSKSNQVHKINLNHG